MRKLFILSLLMSSTFVFAQSSEEKNKCDLPANFEEPKSEKKVLKWLKKFDATTDDLKKHVSVENDVDEEKVILIRISEQKGNGMYILCVDGKRMKYRRMGSVFSRLDEKLFDGN